MASESFYLDNADLRFQMERRVNWKGILETREDFGSEDCPYENPEEAMETFLDMLNDPIGTLAAQVIADNRECEQCKK